MDLLDQIYPVGRDLLGRIDAALIAGGAPPGHPILPLLRRLGALPGDVAAHLVAVAPEPLATAGDPVRGEVDGLESGQASVPAPTAWRGPAAESFAAQWSTISGHLAGDPASMAGRLTATAAYLDDVVAWLLRGRKALAGALAECLGSAEAATLLGASAGRAAGSDPGRTGAAGTGDAVRAAADLGAHVLACAAEVLDDGQRVLDAWAGRLDELPIPAPSPVTAGIGGHLELG
jgi:hypothetical protein